MFLNKIRHIVGISDNVVPTHRRGEDRASWKPIHVARMHPHTYGQRVP